MAQCAQGTWMPINSGRSVLLLLRRITVVFAVSDVFCMSRRICSVLAAFELTMASAYLLQCCLYGLVAQERCCVEGESGPVHTEVVFANWEMQPLCSVARSWECSVLQLVLGAFIACDNACAIKGCIAAVQHHSQLPWQQKMCCVWWFMGPTWVVLIILFYQSVVVC